jgi:hypothetical protein
MDALVDFTVEDRARMRDVTAELVFVKGKRTSIRHGDVILSLLTCDNSYALVLDQDSDGRTVLRAMQWVQ